MLRILIQILLKIKEVLLLPVNPHDYVAEGFEVMTQGNETDGYVYTVTPPAMEGPGESVEPEGSTEPNNPEGE